FLILLWLGKLCGDFWPRDLNLFSSVMLSKFTLSILYFFVFSHPFSGSTWAFWLSGNCPLTDVLSVRLSFSLSILMSSLSSLCLCVHVCVCVCSSSSSSRWLLSHLFSCRDH